MKAEMIERLKRLGLNPKDFEPNPVTDKDRITDLEDGLMALMEMVFGGEE